MEQESKRFRVDGSGGLIEALSPEIVKVDPLCRGRVRSADAERVTAFLQQVRFDRALCFAHRVHEAQAVLDRNGIIVHGVNEE